MKLQLSLQQQFILMHSQCIDQEKQKLVSGKGAYYINNSLISNADDNLILPQQIIHVVQYGDTLQGLSLQYSVPIGKIRFRNQIEGDSIYHKKHLIIPYPKTLIPVSKQISETLLIEYFVEHMDSTEKSAKVARYYLLQTNWNMGIAIKQYKQDLQWERKNKHCIPTQPLQGNMIEMRQIRRFYDKMELLYKKRR